MTSDNDAALAAGLGWLTTPRRVERGEIASFGTDVAGSLLAARPDATLDIREFEALVNWLSTHYPWRLERRRAEEGVELVRFTEATPLVTDAIIHNWRAARFIEAGMARAGDGRRRHRRVSSR